MPDIVVPSGGTTDDQTPEIRIMLNGPLWPGSEVRMRRNGVDVGVATQLSSTEFVFVDNVADGSFEYRAVVVRQDVNKQSAPYFVQVVTPIIADPGPLIESVNNDDADQTFPVPVITGIIGEPIVVPNAALTASLLALGSEAPMVLGDGIHWRRLVLTEAVTDLAIDTAQGEADTVIGLFSSAGVLLNSDDNSGGNLEGGSYYASALNIGSLPAGTYYLGVVGYPSIFSNNFSIVQESEPPNNYMEQFVLRMSYTTGGAE